MLTNAHKEQAEQLARKHGRAANQRSSFTNLLKGKITRTEKQVEDKENESLHVAAEVIGKCQRVVNQSKGLKIKEKPNPSMLPLVNNSVNGTTDESIESEKDTHHHLQILTESTQELTTEGSQFRLKTYDFSEIVPLSHKKATSSCSMMTDECSYQKQLEIKVEILRKERDQQWDSITGIVKENQALKDALAALTMKTTESQEVQTEEKELFTQGLQTERIELISFGFQSEGVESLTVGLQTQGTERQSSSFQTESALPHLETNSAQTDASSSPSSSVSFQTDLTSNDIAHLLQSHEHAILEKQEVLQFCETIYLQEISEQLSSCLNMKDAVSQYLTMKVDNLMNQFQSEKAMLQRIYEEYINQFKRNEELLIEKNQGLIATVQEVRASSKRLQEGLQLSEQEVGQLEESNYLLNSELMEAEEGIIETKQEAERIRESLQSEKKGWEEERRGWEERKRTYSSLLVESHRRISSLMSQLREFQELASSAHYKHLKSQRAKAKSDN